MRAWKIFSLESICVNVTILIWVKSIQNQTFVRQNFTFPNFLCKFDDFISALTIYHALSDGGQFDRVSVITNDYDELTCQFDRFLDGSDWEDGKNCRLA